MVPWVVTAAALGYLVLINAVTYEAFAIDKRAAERGEWRIPESTLLLLALIGGSPGARLAQRRLRHKTRKEPFRTELLGIFTAHCVAVVVVPAVLWGPAVMERVVGAQGVTGTATAAGFSPAGTGAGGLAPAVAPQPRARARP